MSADPVIAQLSPNASAFDLCRKLVRAGIDPERQLHCYSGDRLRLTVAIGFGAKLSEDNHVG